MKPQNLKTKIFLDEGDVDETREILHILGFLDGQTTNPTSISKNPEAQKMLSEGKKFTKKEISKLPSEVVKMIKEFYGTDGNFHYIPSHGLNGNDISFYMNHSRKPNIWSKGGDEKFLTLRWIKRGEELFLDYRIYDPEDPVALR